MFFPPFDAVQHVFVLFTCSICVQLCIHTYIIIYIYKCIQIQSYAHINTDIFMDCILICICSLILRVCVYTHIYTYIYICIYVFSPVFGGSPHQVPPRRDSDGPFFVYVNYIYNYIHCMISFYIYYKSLNIKVMYTYLFIYIFIYIYIHTYIYIYVQILINILHV